MRQLALEEGVLHKYISSLSSGLPSRSEGQQRVAILRALLFMPKTIVLDEAFASLDTRTSSMLRHLFLRYKYEGLFIILVSHDVRDRKCIADSVIFLRDGRVEMRAENRGNKDCQLLL